MPEWIKAAFDAVLELSLTGSAVIAIILLARLLLKRAPRKYSYALWAAALFRLLCPVTVETALSLLPASAPRIREAVITGGAALGAIPAGEIFALTPPADIPAQGAAPAAEAALTLGGALALIWLIGAAALLARAAAGYIRLALRLRGAERGPDGTLTAPGLGTAFALGVLRPRIYLPEGLTERERECVLAHERCHIRRGDHIFKLLAYIALSLHWFNPLVWLAWVLAMRDMESSCDEAAIARLGGAKADYAQTLLNMASGRLAVGIPLAFGEDAKRRIKGVAMMKKHKRYAVILSAALALAVIAGCAVNPAEPGGSDNTPDHTPYPAAADGSYSGGAFGSMEEFFALMDSRNPEQTHEYAAADGGTATAKVEDIRRDIAKVCEIEGLAGDAVIEGYTVESWYDLDVPADEVPLYGDMRRDGEYVSFGTMLYYALRYPDGSLLPEGGDTNANERLALYEGSWAKLVWDNYVSARADGMGNTEQPLYTAYIRPQESGAQSIPALRYDGDGWYMYVPRSLWYFAGSPLSSHPNWLFSSADGLGSSSIMVELREGTVDTSGAGSAGPHSASRTVDAGDGRHYLISASWDGEAADETDAAMAYIVNQILESFTLWESGAVLTDLAAADIAEN